MAEEPGFLSGECSVILLAAPDRNVTQPDSDST